MFWVSTDTFLLHRRPFTIFYGLLLQTNGKSALLYGFIKKCKNGHSNPNHTAMRNMGAVHSTHFGTYG